jgi:hypothetical protein
MSYQYDGWTVDKRRVAYYAFQDKTRYKDVEDFVIEDAINEVKSLINRYKPNYYVRVDKKNTTLNLAIQFMTVCFINRSGNSSSTAGSITSEKIDGMSISYGNNGTPAQVKTPIPKDPCDMAVNKINDWIREEFGIKGKYPIVSQNLDDKRFDGTYNKRTQSFIWSEDKTKERKLGEGYW